MWAKSFAEENTNDDCDRSSDYEVHTNSLTELNQKLLVALSELHKEKFILVTPEQLYSINHEVKSRNEVKKIKLLVEVDHDLIPAETRSSVEASLTAWYASKFRADYLNTKASAESSDTATKKQQLGHTINFTSFIKHVLAPKPVASPGPKSGATSPKN